MKPVLSTIAAICIAMTSFAQIGGNAAYPFLSLPSGPASVAMGGSYISQKDGDIQNVLENPALLDSRMDKKLYFHYSPFMAGINYGDFVYTRTHQKHGNLGVGFRFFSYGSFTEADETGVVTGSFTAGDFALNLLHSRDIRDRLTVGVNLKLIYSALGEVNSVGAAADLGMVYTGKDSSFFAALNVKNLGGEIASYFESNRTAPLDIKLALSRKVAKAPFRIYAEASNLQKWDLRTAVELNEKGEPESSLTVDNLFRHITGGLEFIPSDKFVVRLGYNYRRQQDLKLSSSPGTTGFSFGFGLQLKKISLSYALAAYHLGGRSNHLGLSLDLSKIVVRRTPKAEEG